MKSGLVARQHRTSSAGQTALSISQERLWVLEQLNPGNPVHNVSFGLRLSGSLDRTALEKAWSEVVQLHENLRRGFRSRNGVPQQVVPSHSLDCLILRLVDLGSVSTAEREAQLFKSARDEARKTFDLESGPLLRLTLWRLTSSDHVLLVVAHRIVCDEASLAILLKQLAARYETCLSGKSQAWTKPALQYREFVARQSTISQTEIEYWEQRLAGAPSHIDLFTDRPRPPEQAFDGAARTFSIEEPLLEQLRALGKCHDTTLFVTLFAAFNVLLSRYSRQEDLVVAITVPGRESPELEELVGPIENMILLRSDLSGGPTFSELLVRARDVAEKAFFHQDVPLEVLLDELDVERDLSRTPLVQVAFGLRQRPSESAWTAEITYSAFEVESGTERFDLSLDLLEARDALQAKLSYNTDLFEAATIARMSEQFQSLLTAFTLDPSRRIFAASPLPGPERHRVLVEFNATTSDYLRDLCLHDFFEQQVERTPEAIAVVCERERMTYSELNARANRLAHYLRKHGVGPEVLVGICVERSPDMLVGILGILKAGGAYVPLDPAYPKERLAVILEDAKAPILLSQQKLAGLLPQHGARLIRLDADWHEIATEAPTNPVPNVKPNNLDYVLFTSGSTGRPKGVALEHRSAAIFVQWAREVFAPEELAGTLFSTSVCFDLSVFEIFVPLSTGGTVIIAQNALFLPKLPAASEVTLINTVPSAIAELVRTGNIPASVRVVNLAGEALPSSLAQQIYQNTRVAKVYNLYGPTEGTTYSTYTLVPRGGEVTIGQPLPGTQAYILDENRQPVPIGVPGELYLAGDGLARGYFGRDDLTAERFIPNPFAGHSSGRMYLTGDLARFLPDGNIQYLGRIDNQVKIRGFRIELEEIESALMKHPSVHSAVVLAREDAPGEKRLVAYVVPSGASVSIAFLKNLISERLPDYMIPGAFVEMTTLPLSPNGKINRRMLPEPDWSLSSGTEVVPPKDGLESTLLTIWQNVLGVTNIGVRDNFFDLGGHSLMAIRVLTDVEKAIGKEIPLSALFRGATVASLAQLIRENLPVSDPVVMEIQRGENARLPFFAIVPPGEEALGYAMLARHMGPRQTVLKVQGQAPIVVGRPYTAQEMQALAEEYIAAMRAVHRHGPYCLGGLCDGTHIAEQVVVGLEAQGEEVALFAIFDTWVLQHSQRRWLWKIHYFGQRLREMRELNLAERLASYKRASENKVQNLVGNKPPRTDWQQAYWPENFSPPRFRAPVVLFKRPKQPFYYVNDPQMGWGKRSNGGVEIHEIDFPHLHILREPHVRVFGEQLAECVERVSRSKGKAQKALEDSESSLLATAGGQREP